MNLIPSTVKIFRRTAVAGCLAISLAMVFSMLGCQQPNQNKKGGNQAANQQGKQTARKKPMVSKEGEPLEWAPRNFEKHNIAVDIPLGWKASASGVFSAYSKEGLACVMMKPAQKLRGSKATTPSDFLKEAFESYEKYEIGQPLKQLGTGEIEIGNTKAAYMEMSYQKPPRWQRMICVVLDKPYIIFAWATHENSGERSEDRREFTHDEYKEMVMQIVESIKSE